MTVLSRHAVSSEDQDLLYRFHAGSLGATPDERAKKLRPLVERSREGPLAGKITSLQHSIAMARADLDRVAGCVNRKPTAKNLKELELLCKQVAACSEHVAFVYGNDIATRA